MELMILPWKIKEKVLQQRRQGPWIPVVVFSLIAIMIVWDIAEDIAADASGIHVLVEFLMILAAAVGALYFWRQLQVEKHLRKELGRKLKTARAESVRWQEKEQDLTENLRRAINEQFAQWEFTENEKEIASYLLKGLSLKEITKIKGSTHHSVRQQAYILYRKAGLAGRAELSAFFLGGLMLPEGEHDEPARAPESKAN